MELVIVEANCIGSRCDYKNGVESGQGVIAGKGGLLMAPVLPTACASVCFIEIKTLPRTRELVSSQDRNL
jgi:hypothetical protein